MSGALESMRIGPAPRIALDVAGSGELVVLLHGIGGNRRNWHPNMPALARHFRVAAWDARGYGSSDDYAGRVCFADFADDLLRVLDHLDAPSAHVVGLSLGGRIALEFIERFPHRVRTLTLCDTHHKGFAEFGTAWKAEFLRARLAPLVAGLEPKDIAEPLARSLVSTRAVSGALEALIDSIARLHKTSYMKTLEALTLAPAHDRLYEIRVPVLVACGADDPLTPPAMARELAAAIPGARLELIADAGHLVNIEQPANFERVLLDFLSQHAGGSLQAPSRASPLT